MEPHKSPLVSAPAFNSSTRNGSNNTKDDPLTSKSAQAGEILKGNLIGRLYTQSKGRAPPIFTLSPITLAHKSRFGPSSHHDRDRRGVPGEVSSQGTNLPPVRSPLQTQTPSINSALKPISKRTLSTALGDEAENVSFSTSTDPKKDLISPHKILPSIPNDPIDPATKKSRLDLSQVDLRIPAKLIQSPFDFIRSLNAKPGQSDLEFVYLSLKNNDPAIYNPYDLVVDEYESLNKSQFFTLSKAVCIAFCLLVTSKHRLILNFSSF
jgi:dynein heavy chain